MQRVALTASLILALLASPIPAANAAPPAQAGYIVVLHDRVASPAAAAREIAGQVGGQVGFIYEHALKGFSITVPPRAVTALEQNPLVNYVATDDVRHAFAQTVPTGVQRIFASANGAIDIDGADDYRVDVDVAVIDTGIDFQHPDLNVMGGINCTVGSLFRTRCDAGGDDDHYHGTHVAGTIGALDNGVGVVGVAPGARLWAVKVLNSRGSGYSSWIVAGIDWVAANAATIEVANMSLGGSGYSQAEYDAIQGAVNKGVAFAVAAGNSDDNADNYSPSAFDNVLCVSALADFNGLPGGGAAPTCRTDQDDTLADFSNWGPEVDVAAPGVCILSTYPLEQGGYGTISGTSMASPHVAGALALLASVNNPGNATDVASLYDQVRNAGNYYWTDDSGDGIWEPLLDAGTFAAALIPVGPANAPPVVTVTNPADGAAFPSGTSVTFSGTALDPEDGDLAVNLVWTSSLDGGIGTGGSFSSVLSDGTHTITASVTDTGGLTDSDSISITVGGGGSGGEFTLTVIPRKVKAAKYADLKWSGTTAGFVDVWRDNSKIASSTPNDNEYTDGPLGKAVKSATYKVCEANSTSTCSNPVTVSW
jgi:subtilisin family serine protease